MQYYVISVLDPGFLGSFVVACEVYPCELKHARLFRLMQNFGPKMRETNFCENFFFGLGKDNGEDGGVCMRSSGFGSVRELRSQIGPCGLRAPDCTHPVRIDPRSTASD